MATGTAQADAATVNESFLVFVVDGVRYKICYGGRGSGKSWAISQILVRLALEHERRVVCSRKVAATIRNSIWRRIQNALSEVGILPFCDVNKSDREITLPNGSSFIFVGADDPEKLKSIEDVTDWWLEEATEYDEADFDTIDHGLRSFCSPVAQIYMTFNPIPIIAGVPHWIQRRFFSGVNPELGVPVTVDEALILRTNFEDNAFFPDANRRALYRLKETNPELWKLWGLGEFTRMKGAIIRTWDRVVAPPSAAVPMIGYGLDFGFAIDPAAVVQVWMKRNEIWVQQKVYELELTNDELSEYMVEAGLEKGIDDIIADSAEPKSIKKLRQLGWNVSGSRKWPHWKREAALWARGMHWHVVGNSPKVAEEVATWRWKYNQTADKFMPEPADGDDHCIDGTLYRAYRQRGDIISDEQAGAAESEDVQTLSREQVEDDDLEVIVGG